MLAAESMDVSPPIGAFMAGYGLDRQSTGKYDNVWIKAVEIADANEQLAIVIIDCIGLTRPDILRIKAIVNEQYPDVHLIVSSTHTHAGPGVVGR